MNVEVCKITAFLPNDSTSSVTVVCVLHVHRPCVHACMCQPSRFLLTFYIPKNGTKSVMTIKISNLAYSRSGLHLITAPQRVEIMKKVQVCLSCPSALLRSKTIFLHDKLITSTNLNERNFLNIGRKSHKTWWSLVK
jgi:hypothetical protein